MDPHEQKPQDIPFEIFKIQQFLLKPLLWAKLRVPTSCTGLQYFLTGPYLHQTYQVILHIQPGWFFYNLNQIPYPPLLPHLNQQKVITAACKLLIDLTTCCNSFLLLKGIPPSCILLQLLLWPCQSTSTSVHLCIWLSLIGIFFPWLAA